MPSDTHLEGQIRILAIQPTSSWSKNCISTDRVTNPFRISHSLYFVLEGGAKEKMTLICVSYPCILLKQFNNTIAVTT